MAEIKYLDLNGLKALYGVVDGKITTAVTNAKGELKGTVSAEYDTLGKLEGKIKDEAYRATSAESALGDRLTALESGDNSVGKQIEALENKLVGDAAEGYNTLGKLEDKIQAEVKRATDAEDGLDGRLDTVEGKIDIINGEGEGSIKKAATDAVAKVVANAPEDFDTLKEVADWIANDTTGAAKMQSDIAKLQGGKDVEGSVANSIDKAVTALDATVGTTTIADGDHVAVEVVQTDGKLTGLTVNENDIASAATLGTVKSAQEANTALLEGIPTGKKVKGYVDDAVAAAKAAATTKVVKGGEGTHVTVTASEPAADGSVTYTIGETDIASANALAAEVSRATAAEDKIESSVGLATDGSFTAPTGKNYINGATTVMGAVEKLDAQAKVNANAISGAIDESAKSITLGGKSLQFIAFTEQEIRDAVTK